LQHRLNPPLILPYASSLLPPPQKTLLNYGPALQRHKYCRQTANVWHLKPRPYLLHFSCLWLPPTAHNHLPAAIPRQSKWTQDLTGT